LDKDSGGEKDISQKGRVLVFQGVVESDREKWVAFSTAILLLF
jgi:hypothetical protein